MRTRTSIILRKKQRNGSKTTALAGYVKYIGEILSFSL